MNNFLPKSYEVPVSGGKYMKLQQGDNQFRVLGSAIIGWQYWTTDKKPVRSKTPFENAPVNAKLDNGVFKPKHFWAFPVWNYKDNAVQILEVTQSTIQSSIKALVDDSDWGDPKGYDIKINRSGEVLDTEYTVNPKPHTPIKLEIQSEYANTPLDLNELYRSGDPFNPKNSDGSKTPNFERGRPYPVDEINPEDIPFN